ncbi:MAG: alpha-amylase family glycosyl hydrolase [bacterium]
MLQYLTSKSLRQLFPFGFHTSLRVCEQYGLAPLVKSAGPDLVADEFGLLRRLTHRINEQKSVGTHEPTPLRAEPLITLGLIADALRYVARTYCLRDNPGILADGLADVEKRLGPAQSRKPPLAFIRLFPPRERLEKEVTPRKYLTGSDDGISRLDAVVIEIILLYLTMRNPASRPYRELFDDNELQHESPYVPFVVRLEEFFAEQPPVGGQAQTLFHCLRSPMLASPDSLEGQLAYIRVHWANVLPDELLAKLTLVADIWREDRQLRGLGPGATPVLTFGDAASDWDYPEVERFSEDLDWMSNVVLLAKSVYVWLDQLSRRYGRAILRLDDIPDEELDRLAGWGFRGLWLIGVWERSAASQKIKQWMGNPEAAASAYSLYDYVIAADLGGEEAYRHLRERAWQRGIRLASDMVPNHMGVDSRWIVEHPDWFLQLDAPPYPWYSFTGGNLSSDDRVGLYLEDGYWEHRDAAVIFKRVDHNSGQACYIYHGNDGTSMPWNDTAQLNFLLPEVREAVIQTILHVARKFSIIRFDAAMTLAKKHYQRLWFPRPGDAGAIPSRAERGLSKKSFDDVFPVEFWREVVDRVAAEVPNTLLLAEAFWLMEGYFVRTLGMHRVYNSAFMNMLEMEENSKYRQTIKNVLEFSPEVLKRFVNFMNNPDERTAIEQFGKGDKYFGVAALLVTMPGLPMFGHGQVEGLTEKYGMEYRRAYWDEQVDLEMIQRHEREIFPLMRRRQLFSGAANFALFDYITPAGHVDENVFAFSNRTANERALILYNNAYESTSGCIQTACAKNVGTANAPLLQRPGLVEALALSTAEDRYYIFRDWRTGMQYLRNAAQLAVEGLLLNLGGYQYIALLDWEEVHDTDGQWRKLAGQLGGDGVASMEEARKELRLGPLLAPLAELLAAERIEMLLAGNVSVQRSWEQDLAAWLASLELYSADPTVTDFPLPVSQAAVTRLAAEVARLSRLFRPQERLAELELPKTVLADYLEFTHLETDTIPSPALVGWLLLTLAGQIGPATVSVPDSQPDSAIGREPDESAPESAGSEILQQAEEWLLPRRLEHCFQAVTGHDHEAYLTLLEAKILTAYPGLLAPDCSADPMDPDALATELQDLFRFPPAQEYLQVNQHAGSLWFNQERYEKLVRQWCLVALARIPAASSLVSGPGAGKGAGQAAGATETPTGHRIKTILQAGRHVIYAARMAGYRVRETVWLLAD